MPSPITMTKGMIEESFSDLRAKFEKYFAEAKDAAANGSKLAKGKFEFKYPGIEWTWKSSNDRAKLTIEPTAYTKMVMLMFGSDKEIGWHGLIVRDPENENHFILQDVILFPQEVTSVTVVADEKKYPLWALTLPEEQFNKLRFHGHSHVNMGVTPSSTDTTYYEQNIRQFKDGFYIFMIINKRFETFIQVYDFDNNTFYDKNEVDIEIGDDFSRKLAEDRKKFVTTYTYQTPSYGGSYSHKDYREHVQTSFPYNNEKPKSQKGDEKKDDTKDDEIDKIVKDILGKSSDDHNLEKELFGEPDFYGDDERPWYQD